MSSLESLYKLFRLSSACSDDELRKAYLRNVFEHHPDRNPDRPDSATQKTIQLTAAYAELKTHRSMVPPNRSDTDHEVKVPGDDREFTFSFSFGSFHKPIIRDVAERKSGFRSAWDKFNRNPADPICALQLVHTAFRAERQDSIQGLLLDPVLVDSASLLFSSTDTDDACETLLRWAGVLQRNNMAAESIQMLEDSIATRQGLLTIAEELRRLNYSWAQYLDPTTGKKPTPVVRIEHLERILELGFEYSYIHKMLAEAFHDLGDDERARIHLIEAFRIDPQLSGAITISRALGFPVQLSSRGRSEKPKSEYKYCRQEDIPSPSQIRNWAQQGDWNSILRFADPRDYYPPALSKARESLRLMAGSLQRCDDSQATGMLMHLLNSGYYWDVGEAALVSLSKLADRNTLKLLENYTPRGDRMQAQLSSCLSYIRARLNNRLPSTVHHSPGDLFEQAKQAFGSSNYGMARLLLENYLGAMDNSGSSFVEATVLLARACAGMQDVRTSMELIVSIRDQLPQGVRSKVLEEAVSWFWSGLVFCEYDPENDQDYSFALHAHVDLALASDTPEEILKNLRELTRWLELLGAGKIVPWIRALIRSEAPGTWYVDKDDNRERYVRKANLSQEIKLELATIDEVIKAEVAPKLKQMMKGRRELSGRRVLSKAVQGARPEEQVDRDGGC